MQKELIEREAIEKEMLRRNTDYEVGSEKRAWLKKEMTRNTYKLPKEIQLSEEEINHAVESTLSRTKYYLNMNYPEIPIYNLKQDSEIINHIIHNMRFASFNRECMNMEIKEHKFLDASVPAESAVDRISKEMTNRLAVIVRMCAFENEIYSENILNKILPLEYSHEKTLNHSKSTIDAIADYIMEPIHDRNHDTILLTRTKEVKVIKNKLVVELIKVLPMLIAGHFDLVMYLYGSHKMIGIRYDYDESFVKYKCFS